MRNSPGRRKGRFTNKKWVPVQGGGRLSNKLLVISLLLAFEKGTRYFWHIVDVHQLWDDSFFNKKISKSQLKLNTIKQAVFKKKRIGHHSTPSFPFHWCWSASPVSTPYSLVLILLFLILWSFRAWVQASSHLPSECAYNNTTVLDPLFCFILPVLISLSKLHHLFVTSCYGLYFFNEIS